MNRPEIKITDIDYFFMIENQVQNHMKEYETKICLPMAKKVIEKSNISLGELTEFPTEGYYYETEDLKLYFKILRNIQHNEDMWDRIVNCDELEFLKNKCDNDIFGVVDPLGRNVNAPIKRRYDILTLTMENKEVFPDHDTSHRPWTINRIMNGLGKMYNNRTNLVELAYLTGDPKCLCCGAETNSLNRMIAYITGSYSMTPLYQPLYVWAVTPEIEKLGSRLVTEYNKLMENDLIIQPTLENHFNLKSEPKLPRVALLGYITETKEYYHWILDEYFMVRDVYSKEIITTESYINGGTTAFTGNVFNAKPI